MHSSARRSLAAIASAAAVMALIAGPFSLGAQEGTKGKAAAPKAPAAKPDSAPPAKGGGRVAPPDPTHRVPPGYSRLGLTDQQKQRIYRIQGDYYPKIQALQKQLDALRDERDARCEAVLTREQKQLLKQETQQKKAAAEARKAVSRAAVDEKAGQ
jgi:hypothetical protein